MNARAGAIALLTAAALTTVSCSILKPQQDRSRFYVLTAAAESGDAAAPALERDLVLGLGPIKLPDYLDRSPMAIRVGPNEVKFSDTDRWAEPLEGNFIRVLKEDLANALHTERIVTLPSFVAIPAQYEVPIEVTRFETDTQGRVELVARWAVRTPKAPGKLLYTNESRLAETASGRGTDEAVAAMSRAIAKLSEEIATEIRRLSAKQ